MAKIDALKSVALFLWTKEIYRKAKKTKKQTHYTVTFNYSDKLINVFTGKEESYYFETRDNVELKHYIVKLVEQEYGSIEYDIYRKSYWKHDSEPETTLYGYLYKKYGLPSLIEKESIYDDAVWHCPDTGETFSYSQIRKAVLNDHKMANDWLMKNE